LVQGHRSYYRQLSAFIFPSPLRMSSFSPFSDVLMCDPTSLRLVFFFSHSPVFRFRDLPGWTSLTEMSLLLVTFENLTDFLASSTNLVSYCWSFESSRPLLPPPSPDIGRNSSSFAPLAPFSSNAVAADSSVPVSPPYDTRMLFPFPPKSADFFRRPQFPKTARYSLQH